MTAIEAISLTGAGEALMRASDEPPVRSIGTDPAVFAEFYRAHVDEVTRFVTRRVADPQLAADLAADVFLAVIEAAADYRGSVGGPRTWLFGIARNVIASEFRRSGRPPAAPPLRLPEDPCSAEEKASKLTPFLPAGINLPSKRRLHVQAP